MWLTGSIYGMRRGELLGLAQEVEREAYGGHLRRPSVDLLQAGRRPAVTVVGHDVVTGHPAC